MTDDDKALVEQLYKQADRRHGSIGSLCSLEWKAADSIEAQAAEIERLREALEYYAQELMTGPWGIDSLDFGDVARAALDALGLEIREKGQ